MSRNFCQRPWCTFVLAAVLTSCKGQDANLAKDSGAPPTVSPDVASSAPRSTPSTVSKPRGDGSALRLRHAGAMPQRKLRYHFHEGQRETMAMTQRVTMALRHGGKAIPTMPAPEVTMLLRFGVPEATRELATIDFSITDAQIAPGPNAPAGAEAAFQRMRAELKRYRGTQDVDSRGTLLRFEHDTSALSSVQFAQMMDSMKQSLGQVIAPLPEEAIGKGAKWQVITQLDHFGVKLTQIADYHLVGYDERGAVLDVHLAQSAPRGKISPPGMPEGVAVELVGIEGRGASNMRIEYTRVAPEADLDVTIDLKMTVAETADTQSREEVEMSMNIKANIAPTKDL